MFVGVPPVAEEVEWVGKNASQPEGMTQDSVRSRPKAGGSFVELGSQNPTLQIAFELARDYLDREES
jgi:hypothetical protein